VTPNHNADRRRYRRFPTATKPICSGTISFGHIDNFPHQNCLLGSDLDEPDGDETDFADFRQRLSWPLTTLRHQQARESDLIYEAYDDAFDTELRVGTGR
jgi:hypothetical protein